MIADDSSFYSYLVPSYFSIGPYEIVVIQDPKGNALTIKINYNE